MPHENRSSDAEIAREFAQTIKKKLGNDFRKAILFGSRAKGIPRADSDYDLILVLKKRSRVLTESIYDEVVDFLLERGVDISLKIYSESNYNRKMALPTPFFTNIKKIGIKL